MMSSLQATTKPKRRNLIAASLFVTSSFVAIVCLTGLSPASARQAQSEAPPLFYKFDKFYLNLDKITHVIDEPGYNMPPGSLQVFFDGNQNWVALYGEEADAFRKAIAQVTTDLTPKKKDSTAAKADPGKPAAPAAKKRVISAGGATPRAAASPAATPNPDDPVAAPAKKATGPIGDPGI